MSPQAADQRVDRIYQAINGVFLGVFLTAVFHVSPLPEWVATAFTGLILASWIFPWQAPAVRFLSRNYPETT